MIASPEREWLGRLSDEDRRTYNRGVIANIIVATAVAVALIVLVVLAV
jgi:hypothetical protein